MNEFGIVLDEELIEANKSLQQENKQLKEQLSNNGLVKTCENCEWFGVCPHSYKEYDYKHIIDELEKWLNDNKNLLIHYDYESKYEYIYVDELLDKIKELKGSDNDV